MKVFMLINVKMPTVGDILTFLSRKNSILAYLSLKNADCIDIFILMSTVFEILCSAGFSMKKIL